MRWSRHFSAISPRPDVGVSEMAFYAFPDRYPETRIRDLVDRFERAVREAASPYSGDGEQAILRCRYKELMETLADLAPVNGVADERE
jgi:hypothetical protein